MIAIYQVSLKLLLTGELRGGKIELIDVILYPHYQSNIVQEESFVRFTLSFHAHYAQSKSEFPINDNESNLQGCVHQFSFIRFVAIIVLVALFSNYNSIKIIETKVNCL